MKPESILKADILDIIFENRNKEYGAYELRTHYPGRLKRSLLIIFSGLVVLIIINYWISSQTSRAGAAIIPGDLYLTEVSLDHKEIIPLKPLPAVPRRQLATKQFTTPLIVKQNIAVNPPPMNIDLINAQIGTVTRAGEKAEENISPGKVNGLEESNIAAQPEADKNVVLDGAEIMPEFPGGIEALKRFLS